LDLAKFPPEACLWPFNSHDTTNGTFYGNLQRYFKLAGITPSGIHMFKHTAAKLRRDAGETVEDISRILDHSKLESEQNKSWETIEGGYRSIVGILFKSYAIIDI